MPNVAIGATVDVGQLQAGMATSVDTIKAAVSNIAISFEEASSRSRTAIRGISDEVKSNAQTVSRSSVDVAEATKANAAAQADVRRALILVKDSSVDAAASTSLLAAAQERARSTALSQAAALREVAGAAEHVVPEMAASSAAIRSFEGNVPIRAIERFLGTTLGLGPLLTAAFPIIGAVDLGIMVARTGKEIYDLRGKALGAGRAINEAFGDLHSKAQVSNDDLAITNQRLQDEIDKLSGRPGNGAALALLEARKMADQLAESLREDRKQLAALLKEHDVSTFQSVISGVSSTGTQDKEILADQQKLSAAVRTARDQYDQEIASDKSPEAQKAAGEKRSAAVRAAFEGQIATYRGEAERLKKEEQDRNGEIAEIQLSGNARVGNLKQIDNSAKIANIEGRLEQLKDTLVRETEVETNGTLRAQEGVLKAAGAAVKEGNKAAEQALKAAEESFAERQAIAPLSAGDAASYWSGYLAQFRRGSEEYKKVLDEVLRYSEENHRQLFAEALKADPTSAQRAARTPAEYDQASRAAAVEAANDQKALAAALNSAREMAMRASQDITQTGERWEAYWRSVGKGEEITNANNFAMEEARLRIAETTGELTPLGAAQEQARIHALQHAEAERVLLAELERVNAEIAKSGGIATPQQATERQGIQNQLSQQRGQAKVQAVGDQGAEAKAIADPYLKAFQSIEQSWMSTQRQILTGQQSFSRAMLGLADNLALRGIESVEREGVKWAEQQIRKLAIRTVTNAQIVSSDAATAAATGAITQSNSLVQGLAAAKTAAKNTYAAVSAVPIIGPVLAPIAAAGAFAAVEAFEMGGVVGGQYGAPSMVMAHAGERVLSHTQTNMFHTLLEKGGGENHFHMGGNSFSSAGGDFRSQFAQHETHVIRSIKGWQRDGKL